MKVMNWDLVEESTQGERLPVGGYVLKIVDAEDFERDEYVNVVYDIAEGDYKGHYSDSFGKNNAWAHQCRRYYKGNAQGMFKAFLNRLEESNRNFSVAEWSKRCDARDLVGLEFGAVIQKRFYTNTRGEDKEALDVVSIYAAQDIRNGEFKIPDPKDQRENVGGAESAGSDMYIPF